MTRPGEATAAEEYELTLEPHERRGLRRLGAVLWAMASSVTLGFLGMPSVGEYVVRRRADGTELLRIDAESDETTAFVREHIVDQLGRMTPEEFEAAWTP